MITVGIETSCDETSCGILEGRHRILSNIVSSSLFRHKPFGGVVPEIASRHSLEQIDFVMKQALDKAGVCLKDIGLVAVTNGPGLIGSLFVGVCFAKALSYQLNKPLVGVNHLEAHLAANFIGEEPPDRFVGLLVSGGHTLISLHEGESTGIIGETVDDACGEAYDKVAKILGLGFPGGPVLDRLAPQGDERAFHFTKPRQARPFDFSFSGIKTAVLYLTRKQRRMTPRFRRDVAASFQAAVIGWLADKTFEAARNHEIKHIVVGGGVSANSRLRHEFQKRASDEGIKVWIPPLSLTGDNGVMIARRGVEIFETGHKDGINLAADPNLTIKGGA